MNQWIRGEFSLARPEPARYRPILRRHIDSVAEFRILAPDELHALRVVSAVLPFRVNRYVVEELIDWSRVPNDPIYQLTFPQREMLAPKQYRAIADLMSRGAGPDEIRRAAREIQRSLNPHPAGQLNLNVPRLHGEPVPGMQHKYRETVLFFPTQGQTCHAYCTYCFRWPQFVGIEDLRFASREVAALTAYIRRHREVSDVLFTGGDPMIMSTRRLREYIVPLLRRDMEHLTTIRIGTKALSYWPYRFTTDADADDFLRLVEEVRDAGRQLAIMAHVSHPRELETAAARDAVRRLQDAGAVIRAQAPLIRRVNDSADVWARMWKMETALGIVPYYMFVERDTGPKNYFEVPLARAWEIFREALRGVSGLARTVRGPSMSASPGKVVVDGVAEIHGERVFVLRFLQGRVPDWVKRPFFARYDPEATWLSDLKPAFGGKEFFFEPRMREIRRNASRRPWKVLRGPALPRRDSALLSVGGDD